MEQDGKEQSSALSEKARGVIGRVIEERTGNQGLDAGRALGDDEGGLITPNDLILADDASQDLMGEADSKSTGGGEGLVLFGRDCFLEQANVLLRRLGRVMVIFGHHFRVNGRCLVPLLHGLSSAAESEPAVRADLALGGHSDTVR